MTDLTGAVTVSDNGEVVLNLSTTSLSSGEARVLSNLLSAAAVLADSRALNCADCGGRLRVSRVLDGRFVHVDETGWDVRPHRARLQEGVNGV